MKILITGGSRGIGKAISLELNKNRHDLLIASKDNEKLEAIKKQLSTSNSIVESFVCDLQHEDNIEKLYNYSLAIDFYPEVLILNAGIFLEGSLTHSESNNFHKTMDVNLYHIYHCVKRFLPILKSHESAKIIIIGSTASLEAYPVGALYGVSKWALKGYSVNLRKELMNENIGVTLINPGGTLTDLWEGEELPPKRLLDPSDIGKLVSAILTLSSQAVVEELNIRPILGDFHD